MSRLTTVASEGAIDRRWVPLAGAILITAMIAAAALDILRSHGVAVEDTGQQLRAQGRFIAEQTLRSLQAVDIALRQVADDHREQRLARMSRAQLQAYLQAQASGLSQIDGLVIFDASGELALTSWSVTVPAASAARMETFDGLRRASSAGVVIGPAVRSPIDGRWIVPMARRLVTSRGEFDGVVQARLRIEYFQGFYESVHPDARTRIALLHRDGTLLARHPRAEASIGTRIALLGELVRARERGDSGVQRIASPIDGVEHFAVVVAVPEHPLETVVSRAAGPALAAWREQALGTGGRTLALAGLAAALLVLLQRKVVRLDAARESLATAREHYSLAMAGLRGGHWVWDLQSGRLHGSARLNELYGLPADYMPTTRAEYIGRIKPHPDDLQRLETTLLELAEGRAQRSEYEYRILMPDGRLRWIATRAQGFVDADGRVTRVAGVSVDVTERKLTDEALRASEERFALAVAGSDDGIWVWDYVAGQAFESQRARELQGLPPGPELQPLPELEASLRVHPEDRALRAEGIRAHLTGETAAYECEYRVQRDDGDYHWIRVRAVAIRGPDGQPRSMAGSVSDIDARKRAEEDLRQSEQRYALALDGANDGILDWDMVADRMFASERALCLLGLDAVTIPCTRQQWAQRVMPRVHPDDAARLAEELAARAGDPAAAHDGEYRVLRAEGGWRWLRFRGRTVCDASGRRVRWAGSISDIDALKQAEEALRRSEERYTLAVQGSREGLWDWDLRNDELFLSPRCQELLWQSAGEPLRKRDEWIARTPYHEDDIPRLRAALQAHLAGRTPHLEVEYRVHHHSGGWRWFRQRGVALRDAEGRPFRMAGSMEDITDRKNAEAQRERLEQQLRQSQKLEAMGTLAGGIAHDFNNILSAILGYGEMARKRAGPDTPVRRYIEAALSAGMRAKSLVERILAFSRSGIGDPVPVHVQSVVEEALESQRASAPAGITLAATLDAGNAAVFGDPTQIHQVVMNLCANAVQAMGQQGRLELTLACVDAAAPLGVTTGVLAAGRYVRLVVEDSGVGIPARVVERIFDPFFTTKEVGVGTGLGLSLVHGIVIDLGGGIDVQSTPGVGTRMTVLLPQSGEQPPPVAVQQPVQPGCGETVLLVDDEDALVRLGEEMLADLGYEPVGFSSGAAALASFRKTPQRFDIVLTDESMPEMTGSELVREIRRLRADIPVVMMTGHVTQALALKARELGVAEILSKPLDAPEIGRGLAAALRDGARRTPAGATG